MTPTVDVIIPVFNEEEALPNFLAMLKKVPLCLQPIFIDNGSSDGSAQILQEYEGVKTILSESANRGYGGAIKKGLAVSTAEKVVIIDADGEYYPDVIPAISMMLDRCDVVYTSRFLQNNDIDMTPIRSFGNRAVTSVYNLLFRQQLTDLYTGCKGFRKESVSEMVLQQDGFVHVLELAVEFSRNSVAISEIPVKYVQRSDGKSKMNHLAESLKYFFLVMYYYLVRSRG